MTSGGLATFQDAFARALLAVDPAAGADEAIRRLAAQPGFAVYRNTVLKGCIDALQASFPTVERLVGPEWLRGAAGVFARGQLPSQPSLLLSSPPLSSQWRRQLCVWTFWRGTSFQTTHWILLGGFTCFISIPAM